MTKFMNFIFLTLLVFFLTSCSSKEEAMKTLQNELEIANECKNKSINFEMDCYDLISYKNSFAQIRLGLFAQSKGLVKEALQRYELAKNKGNFYANALLSDLYANGIGVQVDDKKALELLKEVEKIEPIAAYKLSFFYLTKDIEKSISLLDFAANNGVKDAQKELIFIYSNGQYIKANEEQALYYDSLYNNKEEDFIKKIYGR